MLDDTPSAKTAPTPPREGSRCRRRPVLAGAALLLLLGLWGLRFFASSPAGPTIGAAAPEFRLPDLTGQTASLVQYRGKVLLLDFWATWCVTCEEELPFLKRLHAAYRERGFELLAVSVDEQGRGILAPFAEKRGIPWRILLADAENVRRYGVFGLPTKYLLDREGVVASKYVGWTDPTALEKDLQALLERRPS